MTSSAYLYKLITVNYLCAKSKETSWLCLYQGILYVIYQTLQIVTKKKKKKNWANSGQHFDYFVRANCI